MKKLISIALAGLFATTMTGCPAFTEVIFPDSALDGAIRGVLGKAPGDTITKADCESLTSLNLTDLGITNLTGLEYCVNLTFLDLSGNQVSDLAPLASLNALINLNLDDTGIFQLTPLADMLSLSALSLCETNITDITPLVTNATSGGLGTGDFVNLPCEALGDMALTVDIPALEGEGVNVVCCAVPPEMP